MVASHIPPTAWCCARDLGSGWCFACSRQCRATVITIGCPLATYPVASRWFSGWCCLTGRSGCILCPGKGWWVPLHLFSCSHSSCLAPDASSTMYCSCCVDRVVGCPGIWGVVVPSHGAQLCCLPAEPGLGSAHLHPLLAALAVRHQWHPGNSRGSPFLPCLAVAGC